MNDSEEWLTRHYAEQRRTKLLEDKINSDEMKADKDRYSRQQIAEYQERERMRREQFNAEQQTLANQAKAVSEIRRAEIIAQNNLDISEQGFQQECFLQAREIESKQTMQVNQYLQEQHIQGKNQEQERYLQANTYRHEIQQKNLNHNQERYLQAKEHQHALDLKEQERITYERNAVVDAKAYIVRSEADTRAHFERTAIEVRAYHQKAEIDKDKRTHEAFSYAFERVINARLKVWVMEQELKIFGRKATDDEISEYIKRNRDKWEKEV